MGVGLLDPRCASIRPCVRKYASRPSLGPSYAEVIGPWHIQGATLGEGCKSPDAGKSLGADIRGHARGMCGCWHVGLESLSLSGTLDTRVLRVARDARVAYDRCV